MSDICTRWICGSAFYCVHGVPLVGEECEACCALYHYDRGEATGDEVVSASCRVKAGSFAKGTLVMVNGTITYREKP